MTTSIYLDPSGSEEADAAVYLLRCRTRYDRPLADQQIRSMMNLAKDVTRMNGIPLAVAVARAVTLRGHRHPDYRPPSRTELTNHGHPLSPESPLNHAAPPTGSADSAPPASAPEGAPASAGPHNPGTVKIEIELSEEDAACLWHDHNWQGHKPSQSLPSIAYGLVLYAVRKIKRDEGRIGRERAVSAFRTHRTR
jgi:hypothetical protein